MNKLLVTTAISLSLLCAGVTYAANNDANDDSKPQHHYGQSCGHNERLARLSKSKIDLFHKIMNKVHEQNKGLSAQLKSLYGELHIINSEKKFNKTAYIDKIEKIRNIENTISENRTIALAGFLEKLTPDERTKFTEEMLHIKHDYKHHHHHNSGENSNELSDSGKK